MSEAKKTGKVKFFNSERGFGFVSCNETGTEYFVHVSGIKESTLNEDDEVTFNLIEGKKGQNAVDVTLI